MRGQASWAESQRRRCVEGCRSSGSSVKHTAPWHPLLLQRCMHHPSPSRHPSKVPAGQNSLITLITAGTLRGLWK